MITLARVGDVVRFTFQDNPLYLNNGTIEVPVNSLSLLIDESNIATFKKAASNDIFLSCSLDELGMTRTQLINWYKDNMVDEGMTPEEVEDIVESATTNLFGYAEYDSQNTRINFKHDASGSVISSIDASDFVIDGMIDNVEIVTVEGVKYLKITFNTESGKEPILIPLADIFNPDNYYTKTATDALLAGKANTATTYTKTEVDSALSGKQDTLVAGTNITISGNVISAEGGGGKTIEAGRGISITTGETADTVSLNVVDEYYGTVNLATKDRGITNGNIMIGRSYITNSDHAIAIGTTQRNVAGGAKIYGTGGIGIGNNVVEYSRYGIVIGASSSAGTSDTKFSCCAIGHNAESYGDYSTALSRTKVNNESEFGSGKYNVSSSASTTFGDSGNTLFSVGNGTADNARHNAFEIRQNGDIYITKDGQDVKLQDQLGGGSITIDPSLDSGSTNPVANSAITNAINEKLRNVDFTQTNWAGTGTTSLRKTANGSSCTTYAFVASINEKPILSSNYEYVNKFSLVETSAITTSITSGSTDSQVPSAKAVYDNFGGLKLVKLTQAEYDALVTKDSDTLYVVTDN